MSRDSSSKSALITGVLGQDGSYLAHLLLSKGYRVYGTTRRLSDESLWRHRALGIQGRVSVLEGDIADRAFVQTALARADYDEVYNLAAVSDMDTSIREPLRTMELNGTAVLYLLEALTRDHPSSRFFQAGSSEIYGALPSAMLPCDENTLKKPTSMYAAAKLFAMDSVRIYRQDRGLYACTGILFNHESPLRDERYVTRRIARTVARIAAGLEKELVLSNLDNRRDWGFAQEYTEAMWKMLQVDTPDDFVIATGASFRVADLVDAAFKEVGLDSAGHVRIETRISRPNEIKEARGNPSKAAHQLAWKASTQALDLIRLMTRADVEAIARTGDTSAKREI